MATISSSTMHKVSVKVPTKKGGSTSGGGPALGTKKGKKGAPPARRGSVAPSLTPVSLRSPESIAKLKELNEDALKEKVTALLRKALGGDTTVDKSKPHAASTSKDRKGAAADLAVIAKHCGPVVVLKTCGVLNEFQRMLFPQGVDSLFSKSQVVGGLKPSASAISLASMDSGSAGVAYDDTTASLGTDSKRGKTTPPFAREGCLLTLRALAEIVGKPAEPYVVGGFLAAALDECGSTNSDVREAAQDAATTLVALAHPWAFPKLVCPLLVQSLASTEWRVKFNALERLSQCATTCPKQVCRLLPELIPLITEQVWDTKAQVANGASACLLAICQTCENPDVAPAIPAVVNAISKPSETVKAVQELMATTFVATVDAPTLSILCPVLSRGLKEKLAINKRAACIVTSNMSRLVESPQAVAPFGPLLVPELQKVSENVQFEEIRDVALTALNNLTKALGSSYAAEAEADDAGGRGEGAGDALKRKKAMEAENARVTAEQQKIDKQRAAAAARETELNRKEEEERKRFKEAMEAQRQLDKIAEKEADAKRQAVAKKKDQERRSTKSAGGKCQGCGLKKCKKTCVFYEG